LINHIEGFRSLLATIMRLEGVPGIEVLALPLGYALALIFHSILLIIYGRKILYINTRVLALSSVQSFLAAIVTGFCAYTTLNFYATGIEPDTLLTVFTQGFIAGIVGLCGGIITYYLAQSRELREMYTALHKRIFKTNVIVPQDEDQLAL
jgi:uncharacterized membrane protein YjjP (DUF1212 family)